MSICFYFQVHQPFRIKSYNVFDIGLDHEYFVDTSDTNRNNKKVLKKVSEKCYLPANKVMLQLLKEQPEFKISFSFSGVFLDQLEEFEPKVLKSFQDLVNTGRVEVLSETYYHSLSFLYSKGEFLEQVEKHKKKIKKLFNVTPLIFRNTELIYNNDLAFAIQKLGYKGIITEGADHILQGRNPNFIYAPRDVPSLKVLLKNYRLSDDIAFRFSEKTWKDFPLTAQKFSKWVSAINGNGHVINLFMDYETFGEHQWADTGIFDFLQNLPRYILKHPDNNFVTPSEAIAWYQPIDTLDVPNFISWADIERDLSAWLSNPMQHDAIQKLYKIEKDIKNTKDKKLIEAWRRLTTSDHFYYMCTKWFSDGDVHKYFNPYESPYDAFISFMNVLHDLKERVANKTKHRDKIEILAAN